MQSCARVKSAARQHRSTHGNSNPPYPAPLQRIILVYHIIVYYIML